MITKKMIKEATGFSPWDKGNEILYDMCSKYPLHKKDDEIIAKVWLIGRTYAAAIERRKSDNKDVGDGFYTDKVAPIIRDAKIDAFFKPLKRYEEITGENFGEIMRAHHKVTELFKRISKLDKRSLASKYLHFHFPRLFFIYDSRACAGISKFASVTGRASNTTDNLSDNEYRKFSEKCLALRSHIEERFETTLTPREIDKLLLFAEKNI